MALATSLHNNPLSVSLMVAFIQSLNVASLKMVVRAVPNAALGMLSHRLQLSFYMCRLTIVAN